MRSVVVHPAGQLGIDRLNPKGPAGALELEPARLAEFAGFQPIVREDGLLDFQRLPVRLRHPVSDQWPGRADLERIAARLLASGVFHVETRATIMLPSQIADYQTIDRVDPRSHDVVEQLRLKRRY